MRARNILHIKKECLELINTVSKQQNEVNIIENEPVFKNRSMLPFTLRLYQKRIFNKIFNEGKRKIFLHWCRRAGKDACCFAVIAALALKNKGPYAYMLPYSVTARRVIWNGGIQTEDRFFYFKEFFPKETITSASAQEMRIELTNGSIIYITGTDNYDRLRGIYLKALVLSEYAFSKPGVLDVLSPVLSQANAILLINSTPNGYNFSWNAFNSYKEKEGWYCETGTCETLVDEEGNRYITDEMVQDSVNNGMPAGMVRQEFYCEPYLDKNKLYFSEEIEKAVSDGRWYAKDAVLPGKQIHFGLDLGLSDPTVIIGFQVDNDRMIRIVYYHNEELKTWDYHAKTIFFACRKLGLSLGVVFLPHDGAKRYSSDDVITSAEREFNKLNLRTSVIPRAPFKDDSISDAKMLMNKSMFSDDVSLEPLREGLQSYQRDYIESKQEYAGKPCHNWASHIADAYQTVAAAVKQGIRSI